MEVKLDQRLRAIADLVKRGNICADVGTDHGYLCAYLLQSGISPFVYASDINKKPLECARMTAIKYDVAEKTGLILSNGLEKIPNTVQTVLIAGMGGELISQIITDCDWCKEPEKQLILQPMTNENILRKKLYLLGFKIVNEVCIIDGRHTYCVMEVNFTNEVQVIDEVFATIGTFKQKNDAASKYYIQKQIEWNEKSLNSLEQQPSNKRVEQTKIEVLELIEKMRSS